MKYNNSQLSAILHKDGPMIVLAGPGSGKTTVITERTKNLIEKENVAPEHILVITFTKAAAKEMKQRFLRLTKKEKTKVTFGTFHGVFFGILKNAYGLNSSNIISDDMRYSIIRNCILSMKIDYDDEKELIGNLLSEISKIKNTGLDIEHYYSISCAQSTFRSIYKSYQTCLSDNRLIDFDDMLLYTKKLLEERPDIRRGWQNKFQYILVDEFQDINPIQYDVIKMLAEGRENLFIVGDDDQSIYGFRGSNPSIMMLFQKEYSSAKIVTLGENYRCGQAIVKASSSLISKNKTRFNKTLLSASSESGSVIFQLFENQFSEWNEVINRVKQWNRLGVASEEIAILFRTNQQVYGLVKRLMVEGIPFHMRDQAPDIYSHFIAKDLMAYMRLAYGSRSRNDFKQIINKPKRYIGNSSLTESEIAFDVWLSLYEEQPWIAERIEKLEADLILMSRMNPFAIINYVRNGVGYEEYLEEYADYHNQKVEELIDVLDELAESTRGFATFDEWLNYIKNYQEKMRQISQMKNQMEQGLTLSTLHSAKGLEFKKVIIIDVNEGITPYKKAKKDDELEEERRLFYVGMTRAKEELCLFSSKTIHNKSMDVSRFIMESN